MTSALAGGQDEQPWEVKSSTTTGRVEGGVSAVAAEPKVIAPREAANTSLLDKDNMGVF